MSSILVVNEISTEREEIARALEAEGFRVDYVEEHWGRRFGAEFALLEYHAANKRASLFYQERMGYSAASITAIKRFRGVSCEFKPERGSGF